MAPVAYAPETRLPTDLAELLRRADQADPQAADEELLIVPTIWESDRG